VLFACNIHSKTNEVVQNKFYAFNHQYLVENRAKKKTKQTNVITRANHRVDEKVIRVYEANYAVMECKPVTGTFLHLRFSQRMNLAYDLVNPTNSKTYLNFCLYL